LFPEIYHSDFTKEAQKCMEVELSPLVPLEQRHIDFGKLQPHCA